MNWKTLWIPTAALAGVWVLTGLSGRIHVTPAQAQQSVISPQADQTDTLPVVLSTTSYLTDIAQNVAGDRLEIRTLVPLGIDPHGFEPTPADVRAVADSDALIINGSGFEEFLGNLLANAGGERVVISASEGLEMRIPGGEEITHGHVHSDQHNSDQHNSDEHNHADHDHEHSDGHSHDDHSHGHSDEQAHDDHEHAHGGDPHFWTDPRQVMSYVETIRDGLSELDPTGQEVYAANAAAYLEELAALDAEVEALVSGIPEPDRLLVTDHDSLGYFADRYGFRVVGAVIPNFSTGTSPSARELAGLIDIISERTHGQSSRTWPAVPKSLNNCPLI